VYVERKWTELGLNLKLLFTQKSKFAKLVQDSECVILTLRSHSRRTTWQNKSWARLFFAFVQKLELNRKGSIFCWKPFETWNLELLTRILGQAATPKYNRGIKKVQFCARNSNFSLKTLYSYHATPQNSKKLDFIVVDSHYCYSIFLRNTTFSNSQVSLLSALSWFQKCAVCVCRAKMNRARTQFETLVHTKVEICQIGTGLWMRNSDVKISFKKDHMTK
jgi:hypothetical protein